MYDVGSIVGLKSKEYGNWIAHCLIGVLGFVFLGLILIRHGRMIISDVLNNKSITYCFT